ncbi:hypothetical protein KJ673_02790 [Patescibacteria group bacterium]|nr:hypothetical protein [Patescibacteria group bacterium]MCG2687815.1 hypothetical protein [Candidatus Parcubacteria bacterium]
MISEKGNRGQQDAGAIDASLDTQDAEQETKLGREHKRAFIERRYGKYDPAYRQFYEDRYEEYSRSLRTLEQLKDVEEVRDYMVALKEADELHTKAYFGENTDDAKKEHQEAEVRSGKAWQRAMNAVLPIYIEQGPHFLTEREHWQSVARALTDISELVHEPEFSAVLE